MKIALSLDIKNRELAPKLPYKFIRLMAKVLFFSKDGESFSEDHLAIVDTGAPISVIPHSIWKDLRVHVLREAELEGVNQKKNLVEFDVMLVLF